MDKEQQATNREDHADLLRELFSPHVDSFNYFLGEGMRYMVKDLEPVEVPHSENPENRLTIWIKEVKIPRPSRSSTVGEKVYPSECRKGKTSYGSMVFVDICASYNNRPAFTIQQPIGKIPIMVKSDKCWLHNLPPAELVKRGEERTEQGGFFIVKGLERLIRLLVVQRSHVIVVTKRNSFEKRGPTYSSYGAVIRCTKPDFSSMTLTLHYLTDGTCNLRFYWRKQEFMVNAIILLKAFIETTDREIYEKIIQKDPENSFLTERVELMLHDVKKFNIHTQDMALSLLGNKFRVILNLPERLTDKQIGQYLISKLIFVHLDSNQEKFDLLILMIQKLYAFVNGEIAEDNPDSPYMQELLLPGHLYLKFFKERLEIWLRGLKGLMMAEMKRDKSADLSDANFLTKMVGKTPDIGKKFDYFLATGNLVTETGLDLLQTSGYSIVAERLNYLRYISHFRSVHRGSYFATMKTTAIRKLLPESWGFFCPVHTPDGAPCGLLNHLTAPCKVITTIEPTDHIPLVLTSLGMLPTAPSVIYSRKHHIVITLDGKVIGYLPHHLVKSFVERLRYLKIKDTNEISPFLEMVLIEPTPGGQFPGLFLFTTPARMMRPVIYLPTGDIEYIGSYEQVYLNIACLEDDLKGENVTHREIQPTNMMSVVASLIPFSDFNQSPRNMYQCQMGKQTMGFPCHAFPHRIDNKLYRLLTPQSPISRTQGYEKYKMDEYPIGTNAVVAVISYTGYDMEDAMIVNKSAYERGFGRGVVYKSELVDLEGNSKSSKSYAYFSNINPESQTKVVEELDDDGLPMPGTRLTFGSPFYVYREPDGHFRTRKYKSKEEGIVDDVVAVASPTGQITKATIKLRLIRNPVIGDKFSSRHGQKGVMSQLWPQRDMPFTESGMTPDVIINPHAFPSRMTIGMLVESMASKAGALHGIYQDATPFRFDEKNAAVDYFGEQLLKAGFNYYGSELMYSGITGEPFETDIYFGVVYYQRLRHMVGDKYQVRSVGPVHSLTKQPVKGRKKGGGIRFGEMERDSLLAHGVSFLLRDRLMVCSDYSLTPVCKLCGGIVSTMVQDVGVGFTSDKKATCLLCGSDKGIETIAIPYVFRYLITELASMNIRVVLTIE